jgi:hypothetical protein
LKPSASVVESTPPSAPVRIARRKGTNAAAKSGRSAHVALTLPIAFLVPPDVL